LKASKKKQADEFVDSLSMILHFIETRKKPLTIIAALAVIAVAFAVWFVYARRAAAEQAWLKLAIADSRAAMLTSIEKEEDARRERERLLDEYIRIAEKFSGTGAAPFALCKAGDMLYELGRFDEAIEKYRKVARRYRKNPIHFTAEHAIGYCLEAKGKVKEAAEQFEKVAGEAPKFIAVQASIDAGRCFEKLGKLEEAKEAYERAVSLAPGARIVLVAERRLRALGKQSALEGKGAAKTLEKIRQNPIDSSGGGV